MPRSHFRRTPSNSPYYLLRKLLLVSFLGFLGEPGRKNAWPTMASLGRPWLFLAEPWLTNKASPRRLFATSRLGHTKCNRSCWHIPLGLLICSATEHQGEQEKGQQVLSMFRKYSAVGRDVWRHRCKLRRLCDGTLYQKGKTVSGCGSRSIREGIPRADCRETTPLPPLFIA